MICILNYDIKSHIIQMHKDQYSDVRITERLIFESSLYLLNNLNHRVDSFTSHKTPISRKRQREELLDPNNKPNPTVSTSQSAIVQLSHDLTKPLVNSTSCLPTVVLCKEPQQTGTIRDKLNSIMLRFLQRFRNENEDEGNVKIDLIKINRQKYCRKMISEPMSTSVEKNREVVIWLLERLLMTGGLIDGISHINSVTQNRSLCQLLSLLLIKDENTGNYKNVQQLKQIVQFVSLMERQIESIAQCESGSTFVHFWPELQGFSQLIHPLLLTVCSMIRNQILNFQKKQKARNFKSNQQNCSELPKKHEFFDEVGDYRCSRISFINLDGYDSPFNLILNKYLHKYVQYISFPLECSYALADRFSIKNYTQEQLEIRCKIFKIDESSEKEIRQYYKNLLIFPLSHNIIMPDLPNIEPYHSAFIWYIMKELVLNQIREFNPSLVIISQSHLINLKNAHFEAILKQLAVITNTKILLYNNLTHNYSLFSSDIQQMPTGQWWLESKIWEQTGLSSFHLQKIQIFLSISSGNYCLQRVDQQQNDIVQTFQNYKILKYAGKLLQEISKNHKNLQKSKNKFIEYQKRELIMTNYFKHNPPHPQTYTIFYKNVIKTAQYLLQQHTSESLSIINQIRQKYKNHIQQHFNSFKDRYYLSISKQRQRQTMKFITKLPFLDEQAYPYDLIALEFELETAPGLPIVISPHSEVIVSKERKDQIVPVFLINHLPHKESQVMCNYAGIIDSKLENSVEGRAVLKEVAFSQNQYELTPQQCFCNFNFCETKQFAILFWPSIYDYSLAALHEFAGIKYHPTVTSLIFLAHRKNPYTLTQVVPSNNPTLTPRSGCTCYQPHHSNTIFIFGGFYGGEKNYLDTQKDITCMQVNSSQQLLIDNLPRNFYQTVNKNPDFKTPFVTAIHNDFIRPRVEYQIYKANDMEAQQASQIILFGGIGQKFTRPYSLLSHTGYFIKFVGDQIALIKRTKLNNAVPSNPAHPIKMKTLHELPVIKTAQNRRIGTALATLNTHSHSFMSFEYRYLLADQRMTFNKSYEVGVRLKDNECEPGMFVENENRQISMEVLNNLPVHLQLSKQQTFVNLQGNSITLAAQNVLAFSFHASQVYALIHHVQYTKGLTLLTVSEVLNNQTQINALKLREIYSFDNVLTLHGIRVLENGQIGILKPNNELLLVLKKGRGGYYYSQKQ